MKIATRWWLNLKKQSLSFYSEDAIVYPYRLSVSNSNGFTFDFIGKENLLNFLTFPVNFEVAEGWFMITAEFYELKLCDSLIL